jgi:hypothetical protein
MDHCGGCGQGCNVPNATASCAGGACLLDNCNPGYANCDGNAGNGCETNANTPADCGDAIASGAAVALLSDAWNKYCAAEDDDDHNVLCNRDIAGSSEQYEIKKIGGSGTLQSGDTVAIFSSAWDKYCAAESEDNHVMHCNRDIQGPWEKYIISKVTGSGPINAGDTVSFRSAEWNTYCSAEGSGGHQIHCNAGSVGASERFKLLLNAEPVSGGPGPGTICGDGLCAPGVENCGTCLSDCPCPNGKTCKNSDCATPELPSEPPPPLPNNLAGVVWLHHNVTKWPQTANLSSVTFKGDSICLKYNKSGVWPGVVINKEKNTIVNGNPWIFVYQNGTWYAATWEWLRVNQTCKSADSVAGDHIKQNPLQDFLPVPGATYYFMVSGLARNYPSIKNVKERSNVVKVVWPDGF